MANRTSRSKLPWATRAHVIRLGALSTGLLCASCNLLLRFDDPQCSGDEDCDQRGLFGATCVNGLCRANPVQPEARGLPVSTTESTTATSGTSPMQAAQLEQADAAAAPAMSMSMSMSAPARSPNDDTNNSQNKAADSPEQSSQAGTSGMAADGVGLANTGGAAATAANTAPARGPTTTGGASGTTTPCSGAGCPECAVDADCDKLGIARGRCVSSLCFPPESECEVDMDCLARGPQYEGGRCQNKQCVPNPQWRCDVPPPARETPARDISLPVLDGLSRSTLSGLRILVCPKLDLTCANPVGETKTDDKGFIHFTLPPNFNGYLLTESRGYLPAMYFIPSRIPDDGILDGFPMVGSGLSADALAGSLGTSLDEERGHMMIIQKDCMQKGVGGVSFSSPAQDAKSVAFYVYDNLPSRGSQVTSETGQAGFLNLPPGTPMIEGRLRDKDLLLSKTSVVIRAGYISVAFVTPLPL